MSNNASPSPFAVALSVGWFVTGALWFTQAVVPWTATGTLSHSSTIDAASLIRSGAVGGLAPSIAGWLLMLLPVVGLVLSATAFSHHRITLVLRIVFTLTGFAVTGLLTHYLAHFDFSLFGPGALLAWLGCVACVISLVATLLSPSS